MEGILRQCEVCAGSAFGGEARGIRPFGLCAFPGLPRPSTGRCGDRAVRGTPGSGGVVTDRQDLWCDDPQIQVAPAAELEFVMIGNNNNN